MLQFLERSGAKTPCQKKNQFSGWRGKREISWVITEPQRGCRAGRALPAVSGGYDYENRL